MLGVGLVGSAVCGVTAIWAPEAFAAAWLSAWLYWLSVPLAALALVQIHDLTGGRWLVTIAPALAPALAALPVFALLFIPILFLLPELYPWARPEDARYLPNTFYLNTLFFIGRFALYFILWTVFALLALFRSRWDEERAAGAMNAVSGLGLLILGVTVTFASFDWLMSLEPHWSSTIFGLMVGAGLFIIGMALAILTALAARRYSLPGEGALADRFHDLGSILLAVVLLWAYFEFMQFLIIWEENLRDEIGWYLKRFFGPWGGVMLALAFCHFIIPFLALIWSPVKRSRTALGFICGLLALAGLLNIWWMVLPEQPSGFTWLDPVAALGIGGLAAAFLLWRLERAAAGGRRREPAAATARLERA
jgi:hypothetical protein